MNDDASEVSTHRPFLTEEKAQKYIEKRLTPQLVYYETKAAQAKFRYRLVTITQLVTTVAIPVVNVFTHSGHAASVLAGIAAVATGLAQIERYQEHWLAFRRTAEALGALRMRYDIGVPPLDGEDRHERLVADAEALLGQEGDKWVETAQQKSGSVAGPTILIGD